MKLPWYMKATKLKEDGGGVTYQVKFHPLYIAWTCAKALARMTFTINLDR